MLASAPSSDSCVSAKLTVLPLRGIIKLLLRGSTSVSGGFLKRNGTVRVTSTTMIVYTEVSPVLYWIWAAT